MNQTFQNITETTGLLTPVLFHSFLAQAKPPARPAAPPPPINPPPISAGVASIWNYPIGETTVGDIALAFIILLVGLIVAAIISAAIQGLLHRTDIDNRLAAWVGGRQADAEMPPVEKWIGTGIFWLVFIFFVVAFLDKLKLGAASQPLTSLLSQITSFLPKILAAGGLLAIAWVLATLTKMIVTRTLRALRLDERLNQQVGSTESEFLLSDAFGNALYWFIFLLFLPSILSTLELDGTLQPVQQLLNQILLILPNILAAVLIGAAGWVMAQIIRRIVTNLLAASGTDTLGTRFGLTQTTGGQSLSWIIGTLVYVLILIPTAIAALNALKIEAISAPAISMLTQILNVIPQIFTAGIILVIAYLIGRFISDLVSNILTSIGFNHIYRWIGLDTAPANRPSSTTSVEETPTVIQEPNQQETLLQTPSVPTRTPSEIVGIIVLVGIMLFATITATDILKLPALTAIMTQILAIAGRVLVGVLVFGIGLYFANLAYNIIASSGSSQSRFLGQSARIAIIALVGAMALQQMGIAPDIVNLAFGLLFGAIAVAIALAFGLGGRDIASEQIRQWLSEFKQKE